MSRNRAVLKVCAVAIASIVLAVCPQSLFSGEVTEPDKSPHRELAWVNGPALYGEQVKPQRNLKNTLWS